MLKRQRKIQFSVADNIEGKFTWEVPKELDGGDASCIILGVCDHFMFMNTTKRLPEKLRPLPKQKGNSFKISPERPETEKRPREDDCTDIKKMFDLHTKDYLETMERLKKEGPCRIAKKANQ